MSRVLARSVVLQSIRVPCQRSPITIVLLACLLQVTPPFATSYDNNGTLNGTVYAQENSPPPAFTAKAQRFAKAVRRRPRAGATFDLWRQHYAAANRLAQWNQELRDYAIANADDPHAHTIIGLAAEAEAEWALAEQAFRRALELAADDYYPRWRLAETLLRQGKLQPAIRAYERCREASRIPRTDELPIAKRLASLYESESREQEAVELWLELGQKFARDARVVREVASRVQRLGGDEQALQLWQSLATSARGLEQKFDAELQATLIQLKLGQTGALDSLVALLGRLEPGSWREQQLLELIEQTLVDVRGVSGLVEFWQRRLQQQPTDLQANAQLAFALARSGDIEQAIEQFEATLRRAPDSSKLVQGLVSLLIREGELGRAESVLQEYLQGHPKEDDLWFRLAELQFRGGNQPAAVETWDRLASESASAATRSAEAAQLALLQDESKRFAAQPKAVIDAERLNGNALLVAAIERYYRAALAFEPNEANREQLGIWFHRSARPSDAFAIWRESTSDNPSASSYRKLAERMQRFGYQDQALKAARQALEQDSSLASTWDFVFSLQMDAGEFDVAQATAARMQTAFADEPATRRLAVKHEVDALVARGHARQALAAIDPATLNGRPLLGWKYALLCDANQQPERALQVLQKMVEDEQTPADMVRYAASMAVATGQQDAAAKLFARLCGLDERTSADYQRLAQLQMQQGDLAAALVTTAAWATWSPGSTDPHLLAATIATQQNDNATRLSALRKAVRTDPKQVAGQRQLAAALFENGSVSEAVDVAINAIATAEASVKLVLVNWLVSDSPLADERTVDRLQLLGKLKQALMQQRADTLRDRSVYARCLANLATAQGQTREALRYLDSLLIQRPTDTALLEELVALALEHDLLPSAIRYQVQLTKLTRDVAHQEKLARLYRLNGQSADAAAMWDKLLGQQIPADDAIDLIRSNAAKGQLYRSQQLVEAALSHAPQDRLLLYHAGLMHLALGQESEAKATWKSLLLLPANRASDKQGRDVDETIAELEASIAATRIFVDLHRKQREWGTTNRRTQESFFRATETRRNDRETRFAEVFAAAAWLHTQPTAESDLIALAAQPEIPVASLEAILVAAWGAQADRVREACRDALGEPTTIVSLVESLSLPAEHESPDAALLRIGQAWQQVTNQDPQLAAMLMRYHLGLLSNVASAQEWISVTSGLIANAVDFRSLRDLIDLTDIAAAVGRDERALDSLREQTLQRLTQIDVGAANVDTRLVLDISRATAKWPASDADARQRVAIALVRLLIDTTEKNSALGRQARAARAPLATAGRWLQDVVTRQTPQRQSLADVLSGGWSRQYYDKGRFVLITARQQVDSRQSAAFPNATTELSAEALATLQAISESLSAPVERQTLLDYLQTQEDTIKEATQRARVVQMRLAVRWWWSEYDAIERELIMLHEQEPQRATWTMALVRFYLATDQPVKANRYVRHWDAAFLDSVPDSRNVVRAVRQKVAAQLASVQAKGHRGAVTSLAVTPDGQRLVSAGVDGSLRVWRTDGRLVQKLTEHQDIVLCLALSPDGKRLASGGYDGTVRLWNTDTWQVVGELDFAATARSMTFLDAEQLVIGGDRGRLEIWNVLRRERSATLPGHVQDVSSAARLAGELPQFVTGSTDGRLIRWDPTGQRGEAPAASVEVPGGAIRALSAGTQNVYLVGDAQAIGLRTPSDLRETEALQVGATSRCLSLFRSSLFQGSTRLAIGRDDGLLQIWEPAIGKLRASFTAHEGRILAVVVDPNGKWLASGGFDGIVKFWRLEPLLTPASR